MKDIQYRDVDELELKEAIYKRILTFYRETNCKQADIVRETGIPQNVLSNITARDLNKRTIPSLKNAIAIAQYFGITVDELVGNSVRGTTDTSPHGICQIIHDLYESGCLSFTSVSVQEAVPPEYDENDPMAGDDYQNWTQGSVSYPALFFSIEAYQQASPNAAINRFIDALGKYDQLYKAGQLSKDEMQTLVEKRLREIAK